MILCKFIFWFFPNTVFLHYDCTSIKLLHLFFNWFFKNFTFLYGQRSIKTYTLEHHSMIIDMDTDTDRYIELSHHLFKYII